MFQLFRNIVTNKQLYESPGTAHELQTWRRSLNQFCKSDILKLRSVKHKSICFYTQQMVTVDCKNKKFSQVIIAGGLAGGVPIVGIVMKYKIY